VLCSALLVDRLRYSPVVFVTLIVQRYIQNQFNIKTKVKDMVTYLEILFGESARVLWEQWVENYPAQYKEQVLT
jgi:hypothetical protein